MSDLQSSNTVEYHLQGLYSGEQVFWVIVGIQQFVTQDVKKGGVLYRFLIVQRCLKERTKAKSQDSSF